MAPTMSAPLVVLSSLTQGTATTPTTVWISPDRDSATDTRVKFVRGKVEKISSNASRVVRVLMTVWGEIV